jgi:hypothetical protein
LGLDGDRIGPQHRLPDVRDHTGRGVERAQARVDKAQFIDTNKAPDPGWKSIALTRAEGHLVGNVKPAPSVTTPVV